VEKLWTDGEYPVHETPMEIYFRFARLTRLVAAPMWIAFRDALRLFAAWRCVEWSSLQIFSVSPSTQVTSAVHRFQESIAGRPYLIEVSAVSKDRWRAYIVRLPGVPTALMPFYGTTPADACRQLCEWLTRAHAKASNPTGSV
jgi:hypothetical protein